MRDRRKHPHLRLVKDRRKPTLIEWLVVVAILGVLLATGAVMLSVRKACAQTIQVPTVLVNTPGTFSLGSRPMCLDGDRLHEGPCPTPTPTLTVEERELLLRSEIAVWKMRLVSALSALENGSVAGRKREACQIREALGMPGGCECDTPSSLPLVADDTAAKQPKLPWCRKCHEGAR